MCKMIAGDEMRHHNAYSEFVNEIFKVDPSEMMLAFLHMMKLKIVMPAHFLRIRRENRPRVRTFLRLCPANRRLHYVDILQKLIDRWNVGSITNLTDEAEKARDYLMRLPARMAKISERLVVPDTPYIFKWVEPARI